jgi:hypothetical protein
LGRSPISRLLAAAASRNSLTQCEEALMRQVVAAALIFVNLAPQVAFAQPPVTENARQVTIEHYYRIKWGQELVFKQLYRKNHEPILRELQKQGFIVSMRTDMPFTHMAGGPRWDMRVTIVYRDGAAAVELNGAFDAAFAAAQKKLFPDEAKLKEAETERFAMLEEHWDVIVIKQSD